jgi:hypothetical protein
MRNPLGTRTYGNGDGSEILPPTRAQKKSTTLIAKTKAPSKIARALWH